MDDYHLRRPEKEITDPAEIRDVIKLATHMTLAMCRGDEPYLVTVNYGFDGEEEAFYFHCAGEGKKLEILDVNPRVWGQVLLDDGYLEGECDHAFRSVHFEGRAELVADHAEKNRALTLMIDQLEADPAPVRARTVEEGKIGDVTIVRARVSGFTGKKNA